VSQQFGFRFRRTWETIRDLWPVLCFFATTFGKQLSGQVCIKLLRYVSNSSRHEITVPAPFLAFSVCEAFFEVSGFFVLYRLQRKFLIRAALFIAHFDTLFKLGDTPPVLNL